MTFAVRRRNLARDSDGGIPNSSCSVHCYGDVHGRRRVNLRRCIDRACRVRPDRDRSERIEVSSDERMMFDSSFEEYSDDDPSMESEYWLS